jgi:hypothetical protein
MGLFDFLGVGKGAKGQAEKYANQAQQSAGYGGLMLNNQYSMQQPYAQNAGSILGGLQPVTNDIMGWVQAMSGVPAGTQTTLPSYDNPDIPQELIGYLSAPEGSWQKRLGTLALINWKLPNAKASFDDIVRDIRNGANPEQRFARNTGSYGWQAIPEGYTLPNLKVGGDVITTPGSQYNTALPAATTPGWSNMQVGGANAVPTAGATGAGETLGGGLPSWLTPGIDPALEAILRDIGNYKEPYTASDLTTLMEPGELNAANLAKTMSNTLNMRYKQQGLGGSDIGNTAMTAPSAWLAGQRANMKAQGLLQVQARGDELKQQGISQLGQLNTLQENNKTGTMNNWGQLLNILSGQQAQGLPYTDMSPYYNAAQTQANTAQNTSNAYAQQAASEQAGFLKLLTTLATGGLSGGGATPTPGTSGYTQQILSNRDLPAYSGAYYNYAPP